MIEHFGTIFDYVKSQETNFNREIAVYDEFTFHFKEHIKQSIFYLFGRMLTGNKDENKFLIEESQSVRFEAPEQVFDSSTWQFLTTALYDLGTLGGNFIAGTKGDGTAV